MEEKKDDNLKKVGNFVSSTFNKIVNLIIFMIIIGLVVVIGWFWHNSQLDKQKMEILEREKAELKAGVSLNKNKDLEVKKVETGKDEIENIETSKTVTNSSATGSEVVDNDEKTSDWKTYKNEKYKYSFKYPKDWYIYEYEDQIKNKCVPEGLGDLGDDNDLIISKEKLDCLQGDGMGFTGDIFINVGNLDSFDYDGYRDEINNENYLKYNPGTEEIKIGGIYFIKHPALKHTEGPGPQTTRFWGKSSMFNYFIEVKQLDREGNIDPELMKVVNSIVIEK